MIAGGTGQALLGTAMAAESPSLAAGADVASALVYPGAEWQQASDLKSLGLSPRGMAALTPYLESLDTSAVMVVVDGQVVFRYGDVSAVSYLASCRKSILAMLYGNAVASGKIRLDATLREIGVDDIGGLLPIEREATIDDLLTARSGIFHPAAYLGDATASAPPRGSQKPGHYFIYNNWDFNAAGGVFEQLTGRGIYQALAEDLAGPIGCQDFDVTKQKKEGDASRSHFPGYPINLSTRDMARIGLLMLGQGRWRDRVLVPKDWVRKITSLVTPVDSINPPFWRGYAEGAMWGYGRLWWVWDDHDLVGPLAGAFTGWGVVGQFITVLPALRMVIAHKTIPGKDSSGRQRNVSVMQYQALIMQIVAASDAGVVETRR